MILVLMIYWYSIKDAFHAVLLMGKPMFWAGFDVKAISAIADKEEYVKNMTKVIQYLKISSFSEFQHNEEPFLYSLGRLQS